MELTIFLLLSKALNFLGNKKLNNVKVAKRYNLVATLKINRVWECSGERNPKSQSKQNRRSFVFFRSV